MLSSSKPVFSGVVRCRAHLLVTAALLAISPDASAETFEAWSGQAAITVPRDAVVTRRSGKEFLIQPKQSNARSVLILLSRHALTAGEQSASTRTLAAARKRNFEKDGFKVSRFVVDANRGRVVMDISGLVARKDVPLKFSGSSARATARYVALRSGAYVISAIVVSERKNWGGKLAVAYRRAADGLQVRQ